VIIRTREQQQPIAADKPLLDLVIQHFKDRPHDFEQFAADLWRISEPRVDRIAVTRPGVMAAEMPSVNTCLALGLIRLRLSSHWKQNVMLSLTV
jgi:hypothetical protein